MALACWDGGVFVGAVLLLFVRNRDHERDGFIQWTALGLSLIEFAATLWMWAKFDPASADFQMVEKVDWIPSFGISWTLGVDGTILLGGAPQGTLVFGDSNVAGSGNGTLYTLAPQVSLVLTGTFSKTYDGNANVAITGSNVLATGTINNDTIATLTATSSAFTDAGTGASIVGVGSNKTLTASGLNSVIASHNGKPVYGYVLQTTNAVGVGEITQAPLTLNLTKTYDATSYFSASNSPTFAGVIAADANLNLGLSGSGQVSSPNVNTYNGVTGNFSISNPNYVLSAVNARIDKAPLTYTLDNARIRGLVQEQTPLVLYGSFNERMYSAEARGRSMFIPASFPGAIIRRRGPRPSSRSARPCASSRR